MKICFITTNVFSLGGVQRVLSVLANELDKFYDIDILCTDTFKQCNKNYYDLNESINVIYIDEKNILNIYEKKIYSKIKGLNNRSNLIKNRCSLLKEVYFPKKLRDKLIEKINYENYDVVVGVEGINSLLVAILSEKIKSKTIGWYHNSYEAYFCNEKKYYWNMDLLFKKYIKKLDNCVVLTNHDRIQNKKNMKIDSTTIYNPLSFYSNQKSLCNNENILCVARLVKEQKGLDLLIEAYEKICYEYSQWKLIIVGDGPDEGYLRKLINQKGLNNNIEIIPHSENIKDFYLNSSIFVSPSRWEGFGLVITEAMECGVPVIAFANSGPIEIINENEKNGILVERENIEELSKQMQILMKDKDKRLRIANNAIKRAQDFNISNIIDNWIRIINNI